VAALDPRGLPGTAAELADPAEPTSIARISQDGAYDAEALKRRDAIFDQLDARVALLNRDLPEEVAARPPPRFSPGLRAPMAVRMARRG